MRGGEARSPCGEIPFFGLALLPPFLAEPFRSNASLEGVRVRGRVWGRVWGRVRGRFRFRVTATVTVRVGVRFRANPNPNPNLGGAWGRGALRNVLGGAVQIERLLRGRAGGRALLDEVFRLHLVRVRVIGLGLRLGLG